MLNKSNNILQNTCNATQDAKTSQLIRSKILFSFILIFFIVFNVFAGGKAHRQGNCKIWPRFTTIAHLYEIKNMKPTTIWGTNDKGCGWARSQISRSCCWIDCRADWGDVYVEQNNVLCGAWNSNGLFNGYVAGIPSNLFQNLINQKKFTKNGNSDSTFIEYQNSQKSSLSPQIDEDNPQNYFDIEKVQIKMVAYKLSKLVNVVNFVIWLPQHDEEKLIEDTLITESKTQTSFQIKIYNGKVEFNGDLFSPSDFNIVDDGENINVDYIGGDKRIYLKEGILSNMITTTIYGDIILNEEQIYAQKIAESEARGEAKIYPNPTQSILNIDIPNGLSNFEVIIFTQEGIIVKSLIFNKEETVYRTEINVSDLINRRYYLLIKREEDFEYLAQFDKE
jgi:hypothetical protein